MITIKDEIDAAINNLDDIIEALDNKDIESLLINLGNFVTFCIRPMRETLENSKLYIEE